MCFFSKGCQLLPILFLWVIGFCTMHCMTVVNITMLSVTLKTSKLVLFLKTQFYFEYRASSYAGEEEKEASNQWKMKYLQVLLKGTISRIVKKARMLKVPSRRARFLQGLETRKLSLLMVLVIALWFLQLPVN